MKKAWLYAFAFAFVFCFTGASAHAQDANKFTLFGGYSYLVNNWGNGCVAACENLGVDTGLHGYTGSFAYNFPKYLSLEANFSGHNGTPVILNVAPTSTETGFKETERQDLYFYTFGPKVTLPLGNFAPFAHVLVGGMHGHEGLTEECLPVTGPTPGVVPAGGPPTCGSAFTNRSAGDGFALKAGGGLDWNHGRFGIRILELDYVRFSANVTEADNPPQKFNLAGNDVELSAGVLLNLGKRVKPVPPNRAPQAACSLDKGSIFAGSNDTVNISAAATDPDGDPLTYSWTATGGSVNGTGPNVRWLSNGLGPGNYTVTATVNDGRGGTTTCSVNAVVAQRPNRPPTVSLAADRDSVVAGEKVQFTATGSDPDGDRLNYTWRANCGQLNANGTSGTLDTTGANPGTCTVTVRADDGRGGAADAAKAITIQAPPPPPQASKLNSCDFKPAASSRVDNVCKRILDDVALRLQNEPRAKVVIVGYSNPKQRQAEKVADARGTNAAKYLGGKGVDSSRVSTRTGAGQAGATNNSRIDIMWVPEGATF